MRKTISLGIVFLFALAACTTAGTPTEEPAALPNTGTEAAPVATAAASQPVQEAYPEPAATSEPQNPQATAGIVTYTLVPELSTVTYEVGETFINDNNRFNVAVGTTRGISGDITVDFGNPAESSAGAFSVDITELASDSGRRDNAIRDRFLQSSQYPIVTFTPSEIEGLPETIQPGVAYPITLHGDLTIRETTRPAVFEALVTLQNEEISGEAETTFLMSDFGFGPIDILGMLKTEDEVKINITFVGRP